MVPSDGTGAISGYIYATNSRDFSPDSLVVLNSPLPGEITNYTPVPGVQVSLMSDPRISGLTGSDGYFSLENVPFCNINNLTLLEASHSGFSPLIFFSMSNIKGSSTDIVKLYVLPSAAKILTGRIIQFRCFGEDSANNLINPDNVSWQVEGGIGTVYSNGVFVATAVGQGKIIASLGDIKAEVEIEVISDDVVGDLTGNVSYSDGTPAEGLYVTADVISWASKTDASGNYSLVNVPSGERGIKVISNGVVIWENNTLINQGVQNVFNITLNSGPPPPVITSLVPSAAAPGSEVNITGYNFGSSQGSNFVRLGSKSVTIGLWSINLIKFTVPIDASTGAVVVNVGGRESNSVNLIVTEAPPEPDSPYKAELIFQSPDRTVQRYATTELRADFKNIGSIAWDPNVVFFGTSNPYNRLTHVFTNDGNWISQYRIKMQQKTPVPPGGVAEFIFYATPDVDFFTSPQNFEMRADSTYEGLEPQWFGTDGAVEIMVTVIDPLNYACEKVSGPGTITLDLNTQQMVSIKYRNTGTIDWSPDVVHLATNNPQDRMCPLIPPTPPYAPWLNTNRIAMEQTEPVPPGGEAEFLFPVIIISPDPSAGIYIGDDDYASPTVESFKLVADGEYNGHPGGWFPNETATEFTVNVNR